MIKRPGIIICSRKDSNRIPNKPFRKIGGREIINHLLDNVKKSSLGVCLAVSREDLEDYIAVVGDHIKRGINYYVGHPEDPLARMYNAAQTWQIDPIIRITHDKIFVEAHLIEKALEIFKEKNLDYLYSSWLVSGAGFEIISRNLLGKAFAEFGNQNVEHISYAVKALKPEKHDFKEFDPIYRGTRDMRFLIDYEEDIDFIKVIWQQCGEKPNLRKAIKCAGANREFTRINHMPLVTFYTCAYNAESYIDQAILSTVSQTVYGDSEHIIIDDCSTDGTLQRILHYTDIPQLKIKRNDMNLGLSSSSNIALDMAKGKYIIRLDADDVFTFPNSVETMLNVLERRDRADACYPMFIDEATQSFCHGKKNHHVGGALFTTNSVRHVKFTDKLRGYEGLDFFERAKKKLKISYYNKLPLFFYRNTNGSLSKSNLIEREAINLKLAAGLTGEQLLASP